MSHDATRKLWGLLSSMNRMQGSTGLLEAAQVIASEADELGLATTVKNYVYDGVTTSMGLTMPMGWELKSGYCAMLEPNNKVLSSTEDHPLAVVPHSPPGLAEGPLVAPNSDWSNVAGHIVLTDDEPLSALYKASKGGALGIVWYKDRDIDAYSYRGLLLDRGHLGYFKYIPMVQVKPSVAKELKRHMRKTTVVLKLKVDSSFTNQEMPVVQALINPSADRFVVLSAHYCHVSPGSNDNASGSAGLIHAAMKLLKQKPKNLGVVLLWVPEHYGTAMWLRENKLPLEANINLDMIAASQVLSDSVLTLHHNPWSSLHHVDAYMWFHLSNLAHEAHKPIRWDEAGFVLGSDHAPFVIAGTPGIMVLTWPDRFYHSSADFLDKTDWDIFELVVEASVRTVWSLDSGDPNVVHGWALRALGKQTAENVQGADILAYFLEERLGLTTHARWRPREADKPLRRIMPLQVRHEPEYFRARELKEAVPHIDDAIAEVIILSDRMSINDACTVAEAEFGITDTATFRKAVAELT